MRVASAAVEMARQAWEEGNRRLEREARDRRRYLQLLAQVDAVTAELRRRIGRTFTIDELVRLYGGAESWARDAVAESEPPPGWPRDLVLVTDAAFHLYARGARDYEP
jgi:hypothetical protein